MSSVDEPNLLSKALAVAMAALAAAWGWMLHATHQKIDGKADKEAFVNLTQRVEDHMITKAQFDEHVKSDDRQLSELNAEMGRRRDNEEKLFDAVQDLGDKTEVRFAQVESTASDRHIEMMKAIHAIGR
jgi:hypothetical protein